MNCPHCSTVNPDFAEACSRCGTPMPVLESETVMMVDTSALSTGSDFGTRYRIEKLLGQGGMGRVYKAYDKDLDRMVAIKVVRHGVMGESEALKRFKQELVLASKITHRNILRIHDMGDVNDTKYISMAFVEGQDLSQILQETSKPPFDRVLNFSIQLAEALAAAQAEGVIHRDLKPQNILVGKDDHLYVSDFGLAKSVENDVIGMTRTGAFLGTPRYMSPEQVEGNPADKRSDLYAYGLILYEMVAGDVPFTGETTLKVMYQRIQEKPKNPKILNPELQDWFARIIMRCLEKDPVARYQNAFEILADLQQGKASPGGMSRTMQIQLPEFRERPWIWAAAGVLGVVILAFAIPPVRHMILRPHATGAPKAASSGIAGVPPLESGKFVAVLPLQVLGDQQQSGYLAQGIQEALSAKLFQLKDVRVTSADAADKADQKQPLAKIAGALGANLIVQGTIQASGDRIRVVLNLEDVINAKRIWSQEFDGSSAALFSFEDNIYNQLVAGMNLNPSSDELAKAGARPTESAAAYDLYLRGRNALRGHDANSIQSALDYFNQALRADPTFALAYTGVADASLRSYAATKDNVVTQRALAAAQQADHLDDNLPEAHSTLGAVYVVTGRYSEAIAELKHALALTPNSDEAYLRLGQAYLQSGNMAQAIESFNKAVELNPYFWTNEDELGNAYFQSGNYDAALKAFQQITVLEPDIDAGYENEGNVYLQQGKYKESIPYFKKALQIEPYFSTYSNLGFAYFSLKQYSDAATMFEKAVALNPKDTKMQVNLGDAYRAAGQQDKARATYQEALSLGYKELQSNPKDAEVLTELALAFAKIGNAAEADAMIQRARAIDKGNVNYVYEAGAVDALTGRSDEALKVLQEALERHFPAEYAAGDTDLESLQANPQFVELIKQYSANAH